MLYLIGLGLDRNDISLKGIEAIKKCKWVYLDTYTSALPCSIGELERTIGKKIIKADRALVEEKEDLIANAKKANVALLVPGDPLAATTHIDLVLRARKQGIGVIIIHSASILTAVAETGLQLYKFGKTASLPRWQRSYKPESFYDIIKENLRVSAHTLLLIDIDLDMPSALSQIKEVAEKRKDSKIFKKEIVICERLGTAALRITVGSLNKLRNSKKEFRSPYCIILPSKLHFLEAEALKKFKKA